MSQYRQGRRSQDRLWHNAIFVFVQTWYRVLYKICNFEQKSRFTSLVSRMIYFYSSLELRLIIIIFYFYPLVAF